MQRDTLIRRDTAAALAHSPIGSTHGVRENLTDATQRDCRTQSPEYDTSRAWACSLSDAAHPNRRSVTPEYDSCCHFQTLLVEMNSKWCAAGYESVYRLPFLFLSFSSLISVFSRLPTFQRYMHYIIPWQAYIVSHTLHLLFSQKLNCSTELLVRATSSTVIPWQSYIVSHTSHHLLSQKLNCSTSTPSS